MATPGLVIGGEVRVDEEPYHTRLDTRSGQWSVEGSGREMTQSVLF